MSALGQVILTNVTEKADAAVGTVEALVKEYARTVFKVAYSVLRNHESAEDVVQETFVRVWRNARQLSHIENHRVWLTKIAWRLAIDNVRKRPDNPLIDVSQMTNTLRSDLPWPDEIVESSQNSQILEKFIANLPRNLREPLVLSSIEEMSTADIAEILNIPESSVRNRIMRARQMLRQKLLSTPKVSVR